MKHRQESGAVIDPAEAKRALAERAFALFPEAFDARGGLEGFVIKT